MHRLTAQSAGQIIGQMAGLQVIGLDIAKSVFQLHTVDMSTGEIVNVQLKRAKVLGHFANHAPCLIGIEACGGSHHWARELTAQGHVVRLIHAKAVRPFVNGNKTDATESPLQNPIPRTSHSFAQGLISPHPPVCAIKLF
ncbi:hypothetical protein ACFIQG_21480, partial [Comamonas odontotermitis]